MSDMLKDIASILESGSAVIVMVTLLAITALTFASCILLAMAATEFVQVMQTPIPY